MSPEPEAAGDAWRNAVRQASPVVLSNTVAQALGLLALPLLLVVITPAAFAQYSALLSFCLVLGAVASFRLEALLPQVSHIQRPALRRAALTLSICVPVSLSLFAALIAVILGSRTGSLIAVSIVTLGLTTALLSVGTYAAIADGKTNRIAVSRVAQAGGTPILQLAFALAGARNAVALVVADGCARLLAVKLLGTPGRREKWGAHPGSTRRQLSRHRAHVVWYAPATLVNIAATQLPLILAPTVLGASAAGVYALAHRLALVPSSLLAMGLTQAFHHQFGAMSVGEAALAPAVRLLHRRVCALVGVVFFFVAALAPSTVRLLAPSEWDAAGELVAILTVWAAAITAASPFGSLLIIASRQTESFVLNLLDLFVKGTIALVILGSRSGSSVEFAVALTAGTTTVALLSGYRFVRTTSLPIRDFLLHSCFAVVPVVLGAVVGVGT